MQAERSLLFCALACGAYKVAEIGDDVDDALDALDAGAGGREAESSEEAGQGRVALAGAVLKGPRSLAASGGG